MIKVLELKGFKSYRAYNAFSTLVLGLTMLPRHQHENYEDFLATIEKMAPEDQEKVFRHAARFVPLDPEEVEAMAVLACDSNGVPFSKESLKKTSHDRIIDIIVAVAMEFAKVKIDFVTDAEKKN